jgi:transcription elongation factor Elf1
MDRIKKKTDKLFDCPSCNVANRFIVKFIPRIVYNISNPITGSKISREDKEELTIKCPNCGNSYNWKEAEEEFDNFKVSI